MRVSPCLLIALFAIAACADMAQPRPDAAESDVGGDVAEVSDGGVDADDAIGAGLEHDADPEVDADTPEVTLDASADADVGSVPDTDTPGDADVEFRVTFLSAPADGTANPASTFTFEAPGAASFECALDDDEPSPCLSPAFAVPMTIGSHRFTVVAFDDGGEAVASAVHTWSVASVFDAPHPDLVSASAPPEPVEPGSWRGISRIQCHFSHSSYNDPIVRPGHENGAHLHSFYGNSSTDHNTTTASIYQQPASTCQGNELNGSSYWVPALLAPRYDASDQPIDDDGDAGWQVVPAISGGGNTHELFYYSAGIDDLDAIQNIPAGLRIVAGLSSTTFEGPQQDTAIVRWHCRSWASRDSAGGPWSSTIPRCEMGDQVRFDIFFPSCWDGQHLDADDHASHMAYPITTGAGPTALTTCPDSHPVPLIRPSYHYAFPVTPANAHPVTRDARGWRLASDDYTATDSSPGGASLHGDWMNGWHPEVLETILDNCIRAERDCHDGHLGNGLQLGPPPDGAGTEPAIAREGRGMH